MPPRFTWILPGRLAGCACPGRFSELGDDLAALEAEGIRDVVTLTESPLVLAGRHPFRLHHLPVSDMGVPTFAQVRAFCAIADAADTGAGVAVHCLYGIGRTGTFLASYLMWKEGLTAASALARVRGIRPEYVQSRLQEAFLADWEAHVKAANLPHNLPLDLLPGGGEGARRADEGA